MDAALWIYIGRFQPFHNGHKSIVDAMIQENNDNLIFIGITLSDDWKNPYSFEERRDFLKSEFWEEIIIEALLDNPSDQEWIRSILFSPEVKDKKNLKIYCWDKEHDSAIKVIQEYIHLFEDKKIEIIEIDRRLLPISGTQIRHEIQEEWIKSIENLVPSEVYKALKKTG